MMKENTKKTIKENKYNILDGGTSRGFGNFSLSFILQNSRNKYGEIYYFRIITAN